MVAAHVQRNDAGLLGLAKTAAGCLVGTSVMTVWATTSGLLERARPPPEVKTTTTDEYEFDIGESELRAARAPRKGTYRIIFIRSVLQSDARRLFVLPNPLELSSSSSFLQINQGMRFRFDPTSAGHS